MILSIIYICISCCFNLQSTQNQPSKPIQFKNYKGYIFNKDYPVFKSIKNQKKRYTPTEEDIKSAEKVLKIKLKDSNQKRGNQFRRCPIIHKKLKKYTRQYVGFINKDDEKVIWINCLWDRDIQESELSEKIIFVNDGCSYHWNIEVNLNQGKLMHLYINGVS